MKIGVLGNCQAQGVAQSLRLLAPDVEVLGRSVAMGDGKDPRLVETIAQEMASCDVALIQDAPRLAALFAPAIERSGGRVRRWPTIVFRGFHPDCVYVLRQGQVVDGVVGPYHSALLCAAWAEGLSPARAARLFNSFSYAALGYFDAFDEAAALLAAQAQRLGFDLSAFLKAPTASFMHTINHPTAAVLHSVAQQALAMAGVPHAPAALPDDALAHGPIWPVYPELARRRGWTPGLASWEPRDMQAAALRAPALRAYASLDRMGDRSLGRNDDPGEQPIGRARAFIRAHVVHTA